MKRMIGLDILRVFATFTEFMFHSLMYLQIDYLFLSSYVSVGCFCMTIFFMMSGFSLFSVNSGMELGNIDNIKIFYKKRLLAILPLYFFVYLIYLISLNSLSVMDNIRLAPVEVLCMQSAFNSLFHLSHNGGTWFVSCIMICYLIYPFLQEVVKQMKNKSKIVLLLLLFFLTSYSPFFAMHFEIDSVYSNPCFRILEFLIGTIIASMKRKTNFSRTSGVIALLLGIAVLVVSVSCERIITGIYWESTVYNVVSIPIVGIILYFILNSEGSTGDNEFIMFLSKISYSFYMVQCLLIPWKGTNWVISSLNLDGNTFRFWVSFCITLISSLICYYIIERGLAKVLKRVLFFA